MAYKQAPKSPVLKRCWEGYSPVPGKKKEEQGSCAKSPAKIRKALSTKVTKAKQPGDEGYVKPKETSKFMRKAGTHASGGGQDRDIKIKSPAKRTKPHKAGMSAAERKTYNNKTGGNLKAPQPGGGSRKKSYCARSAGIKKCKDPDKNGDCPNDIARRNWKC